MVLCGLWLAARGQETLVGMRRLQELLFRHYIETRIDSELEGLPSSTLRESLIRLTPGFVPIARTKALRIRGVEINVVADLDGVHLYASSEESHGSTRVRLDPETWRWVAA